MKNGIFTNINAQIIWLKFSFFYNYLITKNLRKLKIFGNRQRCENIFNLRNKGKSLLDALMHRELRVEGFLGRAVLDDLDRWAGGLRVDMVVTTLKDLVKIDRERVGGVPLEALEVALDVLSGGDALEAAILRATDRSVAERHA